jgi:hypothetical protein
MPSKLGEITANIANQIELQLRPLFVQYSLAAFTVGARASWRKSSKRPLPPYIVSVHGCRVSVNMSHETAADNPFLSTKPSDSNLTISLHPLVLLTVSDHITRHRVRGETGPIVGALLGQQNGRETTVEHAFPCKTITSPDGEIILDQSWFDDRWQQCA